MAKTVFQLLTETAPANNTIVGAKETHLETSKIIKSFQNLGNDAIIIGNVLQAAINLVDGISTSIARVADDKVYFECVMRNKDVVSLLYDESNNTISFAGRDITSSSEKEVWPLATILIFLAADKAEKNQELIDVLKSIRMSIQNGGQVNTSDAFILCDNINCRMTSKKKRQLDISLTDVTRKKSVNEENGQLLVVAEDLTPAFTGNVGSFVTINESTTSTSTTTKTTKMFTNAFAFGDELSEVEMAMVPNVTGAVATIEIEDALETIAFTKDVPNECINLFMVGPSGTGKSFNSMVIASELNVPYYSMVMDDTFNGQGLKGTYGINDKGETYYEPSWFAKAIQRPCVIEVAEVNAAVPTALTALYDVLDKYKRKLLLDDGTVVRRHPHCVIIFTCNAYGCMNTLAKSLPARSMQVVRLKALERDDIRNIFFNQIDGMNVDDDIVENVLDCYEQIEDMLHIGKAGSKRIPKDCESSMRAYAYWMLKCQISKKNGHFNPIYAAKATILPVISSGANFNEEIEQVIIDTIISPVFDFVEG